MKKFLISLIAFLTLCGVGNAQVSDVTLGYCNGTLPDKGDLSYSQADDHVSAAIFIPAGTINTFAGNSITGINVGLASKLNIDELTAWVRTSPDGENLAEATIGAKGDVKIAKGWNKLMFETPLAIEGGNTTGYYIGYTYHQKGSCFGVATVDGAVANSCFLKFGDKAEWEDRSGTRIACVEAFIRGDKLPKLNLSLLNTTFPDILIVEKGEVEVSGRVKNLGTHTVTDYDVCLLKDGAEIDKQHVTTSLAYNAEETFSFTFKHGLTSVGDGSGSLTLRIDAVNGGTDEDMTDNEYTASFSIVQHDFTRKILVEEFTTENCPNCPRVANLMHTALEKKEFSENVIAVCHHSGYYTDWLTSSFDNAYLWFFGEKGSYAPAMMVDRKAQSEDTPVWNPPTQSEMEGVWRKSLNSPAFVSVNIAAEFDPENAGKLKVKVNGARSMEDICDNPVITVYVVEDDILARSQAGATPPYIHNHVNRAVNSTWGDALTFSGNEYTYECEFALSQIWKRENLQVVAFVSNYNSENRIDCQVLNTNNLMYENFGNKDTAVDTIGTDDNASEQIYTISGMPVSDKNLAPGIYIIRDKNGNARKIVR